METTLIKNPNTTIIENMTLSLIENADVLTIQNNEEFQKASDLLSSIKALQKQVKETFAEPKDLANKLHKSLTQSEKKHLGPLQDSERKIISSISTYLSELTRLKELEDKKKNEEIQRQNEILFNQEKEKKNNEAEKLKELGFIKEAEQIQKAPILMNVIVEETPNIQAPKHEKITSSIVYKCGDIDISKLPERYILKTPNMKLIEAEIKSFGMECSIPGVTVIKETKIRAR